jgi:hypothetical protein
MAYYGSQDSMAMYYRNMGLEPDGTTPLAPAPSPVPTPMPAAGAAGPAFQPQQMAGALQGGDSYQAAADMVGAATGAPRPDFGGEMQPRPAGRIQERQMYGDRDRYIQDRQRSQNPAFQPQQPMAGAAGPAFQPQLQDNMNYAEDERMTTIPWKMGALQGGDSYQGMVGAATGAPRPDFGGRIQERQMYEKYIQNQQKSQNPAFQPQQPMAGAAGSAFQPQQPTQYSAGGGPRTFGEPQKSWAPATFPGQGVGGPSSSMQPLPQAVDQQSRAYGAVDQQNLASVQPQKSWAPATFPGQGAKSQASVQPQSQRPSPQPFRPMGPKQSPARSPMSASSSMGGNPQNTRPRQPNPAMPPPGQPMRGPRRSTPMGS